MAIREDALASEAFQRLSYAYHHRKAVLARWKNEGKQVVCTTGYDVPEEILLAAGLMPFRVTGYYGGQRKSAEKYLEYSFGAVWKGLWDSVTEDYAGLMDYLVFSSSSDMLLKLYYYLRALQRLEPDRALPELLYLDFELVEHRFKTQERNERELQELIAAAEKWSGQPVTEENLRHAIAFCGEYRQALAEFDALRTDEDCRVTGSEALTVIGGAMFMERAEAIEAVRRVTKAAVHWPQVDGQRVYYVGSPQETDEVYLMAEQNGLNIVGEDHDMGARYYDAPLRQDIAPVAALAERLLNRMPSGEKGSIPARVSAVCEKLTQTKAHGLLTYMNNNDEAYVWDLPSIQRAVPHIPCCTVEKQTWPLTEPDRLARQFRDFACTVKEAHRG